jgi:uncharacterized membrane protein
MKNRFLSRFDAENIRKIVTYLAIAVSLITISLVVGISDNILMISMLLIGIIILLIAALYFWEKSGYYAILAAVCL